MDYGHEQTDKMLKDLEKKIRKEYKQAAREVEASMNKWLAQYKKNDTKMRELWKSGKITKSDYTDWRKKQIILSDKWKAQREELTARMMEADKAASKLINEHKLDVYALNYNYGTYEVEKGTKINTGFSLYNRDTVARLVKDNPNLLPPPGKKTSERIRKKELKRWNKKQVQSVMTQGILQGESIQKISKRLAVAVGEKNAYSHYRAARTMTTGAENAGRMASYKRAEDMGIKMGKTWLAAHDNHTRRSHREYDGMTIPLKEEFAPNLMFPGDPDAEPAEIYNCRCTMIADIMSIDGIDLSDIGAKPWPEEWDNIDYEEWKHALDKPKKEPKAESKPEPKYEPKSFDSYKLKQTLGSDYDEFRKAAEKSDTSGMYARYADDCRSYTLLSNGGRYSPAADSVQFSFETHQGMSKYSTVAHEIGHMFDSKIGRADFLNYKEVDLINSRCTIGSGMVKAIKVTPSMSDEFLGALRKDMDSLGTMVKDRTIRDEFLSDTAKRNATSGIQDALDGFYSTQKNRLLPWGHGESYYNRAYNRKFKDMGLEKELKRTLNDLGFDASNQTKVKRLSRTYEAASEAWANTASAVTCGGPELEAMEKYMPETVKAFREIARRF